MKSTYQVFDIRTGEPMSDEFTMSHRAAQFRIGLCDDDYKHSEIITEYN